ncbi:DNA polymerase III subunit gamma/tau [Sphingomonas sp. LY29]|uniref:DNA polymerase III subunit gamma/tau n=1 Tax=Sphingomonas sp. LY29 TaxID=3095341 RepID=UPI002D787F30|nr:DNA polymerase III subunit gamma/tau [Sphingomonas sp. LY29]WRP26113.1 DNA polymerase III subunit gamma/tau [Sphingomonas sp. LY29]
MNDDESPGLGLELPEVSQKPAEASPYRVLARKYRPQTFAELIGQDAMVTTLANAIERGRIAHAFLLTGVRGVGKTSTARLVAKALNCIGPDGQGGPTINPCGVCEPCRAIAEGRHIDVIEMDAASHTGVDDVREIIEAVRYAAVSARYKIYIIDEVHMLSKNAFNALLKTLEEPPAHVKFLFATTEVNKVPVTVLSRCQRFDLRRIPADSLAQHFARVAEAESVEVEPEALQAIARAAEGSARDGLSILDQAIAHGEGKVTAAQVRDMLGAADRGRIRRLLDTLLSGDAAATLGQLDEAHALGIEPASLLRGLMESLHAVTRSKAGGSADLLASVEEREAAADVAARLSWGHIHRLWQLLLKGLQDVGVAPDPQEAATMALLRLIHALDMPDPSALAAMLSGGGAVTATTTASAGAPPAKADPAPADFAAFIAAIEAGGGKLLALQLHDMVGLVSYAPGEVVLKPLRPLGAEFPRLLATAAKEATGMPWEVRLADDGGAPSLQQQEIMAEEQARAAVMQDPNVRALLDAFPDATLESIDQKEA